LLQSKTGGFPRGAAALLHTISLIRLREVEGNSLHDYSRPMCGAYRLQTAAEAVRQFFPGNWEWDASDHVQIAQKLGPSAKGPGNPSNHKLVVRLQNDSPQFDSLRWRFETKWMRDKGVRVPINARSETMWANGLFKYSVRDKRCLIIVDGFFEPKGPKGGKREQYLFAFPDNRPFALGGLWTRFKSEDDEFDGFVICTTKPNDQVGEIHSRMPIILDSEEEWESWLAGDSDDVRRLCESLDRPELHGERAS